MQRCFARMVTGRAWSSEQKMTKLLIFPPKKANWQSISCERLWWFRKKPVRISWEDLFALKEKKSKMDLEIFIIAKWQRKFVIWAKEKLKRDKYTLGIMSGCGYFASEGIWREFWKIKGYLVEKLQLLCTCGLKGVIIKQFLMNFLENNIFNPICFLKSDSLIFMFFWKRK